MGPIEELLAEQAARLAALDPMLPSPPAPLSDGELIEAATPDGRRVGGVLRRHHHPPGAVDLLWSAAEVWELSPVVGDTGGMDALLRALRARLDRESPSADSSCVVGWPSRDAGAARAFLDHGMVPLNVLAVRGPAPGAESTGDVAVRRAGPDDFDRALPLVVATSEHVAQVGGQGRADVADLLAPGLRRKLDLAGPVWLAERSGRAIGVADCGWSGLHRLLPDGMWGYLHNVGVLAEARGSGAGRALAAAVHDTFHRSGVRGTYLYYNPPNPLSSVFWHRQGYRPLWTFWEVRPASALR